MIEKMIRLMAGKSVQLSAKGNEITKRIQDQYKDVGNAVNDLSKHTRNDLWEAIGEWEYLLNEKSLWLRVLEQKKSGGERCKNCRVYLIIPERIQRSQ